MAKYIDKAVALSVHEPPKSNRYYQADNLDDAYRRGWDDALCSIEHIPAADVAPVVHSYWEHMISSDEENIDVCHNCKYPVSRFWGITKYCPNCGAKMDGDTDNG